MITIIYIMRELNKRGKIWLKKCLNSNYFLTGLIIAIIIILTILLISSLSGTFLFLLLLVSFSLLLVFAALGYWAYEQKRRMYSSAISGPLSAQEMNVLGINFRTTTIPVTSYLRSQQQNSFYPNSTITPSKQRYWMSFFSHN